MKTLHWVVCVVCNQTGCMACLSLPQKNRAPLPKIILTPPFGSTQGDRSNLLIYSESMEPAGAVYQIWSKSLKYQNAISKGFLSIFTKLLFCNRERSSGQTAGIFWKGRGAQGLYCLICV